MNAMLCYLCRAPSAACCPAVLADTGIRPQFVTMLRTSDGYWHWPSVHERPGSVGVTDGSMFMAAHLVGGSPRSIV